MATSHPRDRFDEVPPGLERTGAHRAPAARGRVWIAIAWAALATGLLVVLGLFLLSRFVDDVRFDIGELDTAQSQEPAPEEPAEPEPIETPTPTPPPTAEPGSVDFGETTIAVLNGTTTSGLAGDAADALEDRDWQVATRGNADGDAATTTVYYADAADEAVARGVAAALGVADVQLSGAFSGASVTVVLGEDFSLPE